MSILITIRTKIILCRLPSLRSYLKSGKTLKNMKKITLFIMDVGVLDQRFLLARKISGVYGGNFAPFFFQKLKIACV